MGGRGMYWESLDQIHPSNNFMQNRWAGHRWGVHICNLNNSVRNCDKIIWGDLSSIGCVRVLGNVRP